MSFFQTVAPLAPLRCRITRRPGGRHLLIAIHGRQVPTSVLTFLCLRSWLSGCCCQTSTVVPSTSTLPPVGVPCHTSIILFRAPVQSVRQPCVAPSVVSSPASTWRPGATLHLDSPAYRRFCIESRAPPTAHTPCPVGDLRGNGAIGSMECLRGQGTPELDTREFRWWNVRHCRPLHCTPLAGPGL